MNTLKQSELVRIYSMDKDRLNTLQMIMSLKRGQIISKIEVLHKVLEESLSKMIQEEGKGT